MTYDQAQSPRLGQRVPIEATYVSSYDVDPSGGDADLVEAAWPGMLIHRSDTHALMIFRDGGWEDISGGVAGSKTYVGTEPPTGSSYNIGDLWYDSDDGYRAYVWTNTPAPGHWEPTKAGGGILTFRQPDPPTSVNIGDIWIDSSDGDRQYRANKVGISVIATESPPPGSDVWSDGWVPAHAAIDTAQQTADRKTRVYYEDGWQVDSNGDPITPHVLVPLTQAPDGTQLTQGDLWYQTDNNNWCRFYTGVPAAGVGGWVDVADPNVYTAIGQINDNATDIHNLQGDVNELLGLSYSANNTADTADGRISTSDYRPSLPDDLTYIQYRTVFDPDTGESSREPYSVDRVDGSIWFMQTRSRHNMCTNPSLEVNLVDWSAKQATLLRDNPPKVPAGDWTITVTNSATVGTHQVIWGDPNPTGSYTPAVPAEAKVGQTWSASIFVELVGGPSGTDGGVGAGVYIELVWVDADEQILGVQAGDPLQLKKNVWIDEQPMEVVDWRLWAHGEAPPETAGVFVRVISPAGNEGDVWHCGALLLEMEPDLGRYFDGTSYDGHWDGVQHNSTSYLGGEMIREIWELRHRTWSRKYLDDNAIAKLDASILSGTLPSTTFGDNTIAPTKLGAQPVQALENLAYGDIVSVYNVGGNFFARKADATVAKNYEAHGFVWDTVASGQMVHVYHQGYISWPDTDPTNYTPGAQWLSTTPGKVQRLPPRAGGSLVQQVGFAASAKVLNFEPHLAIKIN